MVIVSGGIDIRLVRPSASAPLHWAYCFKVGADAAGDSPDLTARRIVRADNAGLIIYTKVNPLVITLGTLICLPEALCCFPVWPERRGTRYWWIPDGVYRFR